MGEVLRIVSLGPGTPCPRCHRTLCRCGRTLERRTPVRAVNPERRKRLFRRNFASSSYVEALHAMPCAVCGVTGWTVAAHTRSRGAGGDASDMVPLCRSRLGVVGCHELLDTAPWDLPDGTVGRLRALAARLWTERAEGEAG